MKSHHKNNHLFNLNMFKNELPEKLLEKQHNNHLKEPHYEHKPSSTNIHLAKKEHHETNPQHHNSILTGSVLHNEHTTNHFGYSQKRDEYGLGLIVISVIGLYFVIRSSGLKR